MAQSLSSYLCRDNSVTLVGSLAELKAAFSAADGGTGAATAPRIKLTADIAGLDVELDLHNVKRLDLGGFTLTMAAGGGIKATAHASTSGTLSGFVGKTVTGAVGTTFTTAHPVGTVDRSTQAVVLYMADSTPVPYNTGSLEVISISSDVQLVTAKNPAAFYAALAGTEGFTLERVNRRLWVGNGRIDFNSQSPLTVEFHLAASTFQNLEVVNLGAGAACGFRFFHCVGLTLANFVLDGVNLTTVEPLIFQWSSDVLITGGAIMRGQTNNASARALLAFACGRNFRVIGTDFCDGDNSGAGAMVAVSFWRARSAQLIGCTFDDLDTAGDVVTQGNSFDIVLDGCGSKAKDGTYTHGQLPAAGATFTLGNDTQLRTNG